MNLSKAKIFLDKINRDFSRMSKDPDTILRIDVDIMMSNVRELYDALLSEEDDAPATKSEHAHRKPAAPRHHEPSGSSEPVASNPAPPAPPVASVPAATPPPAPPPAEQAPPPEEKPAPAPPPPPVVIEPVRVAEPLPTVKIQPPVTPPASFPAVSPDAEALFDQKQVKELSEKLSELPIPDLRRAIALNDKLLLTRELFGGDNQAFENAINALNGFTGMEQAKSYLLDQCVMRYRWTDKKHAETAKNFIKLVRRRYN